MDTLVYSHIKPFFNSTYVFEQSSVSLTNPIASSLFKKSVAYSEVYPNANNLSVCYTTHTSEKLFYGIDWALFFVLLIFAIVTYVKVVYVKVFHNTITALTNFQIARQFINEKSGIIQKTSSFLYTLYLLNFSLFAFTLAQYFGVNFFTHKILDLLFLLAFASLFYSLKILLYKFMGFLIDKSEETTMFLNHFGVFFKNLAILLTPFTTAALYINRQILPYWLGAIFFILVLFSFLRIYRALKLSYQMQYSLFYIFLYLCTVEIVPIVYSIKILKMWV